MSDAENERHQTREQDDVVPFTQDAVTYPSAQPLAASAPPQTATQGQMTVVPRNAVLCVIASVLFPGLGSGLANGKWGKGAAFFFGQFLCIPLILVFGLGIILLFGIRIWACIDANSETQAWNRDHGFIT